MILMAAGLKNVSERRPQVSVGACTSVGHPRLRPLMSTDWYRRCWRVTGGPTGSQCGGTDELSAFALGNGATELALPVGSGTPTSAATAWLKLVILLFQRAGTR